MTFIVGPNRGPSFWNREPVAILAVVSAVIALAVGFGLNWSAEQVTLVFAAVQAVVAFIARSTVTAPANVVDPSDTEIPNQ